MTVKEITLLSKEEYKKYESVIPRIDCWWWLRSPGKYMSSAATVRPDGVVTAYSYNVNDVSNAVRPALKLNLEFSDSLFWYKSEKLIGTKIKYGKYNWTILDVSFGELYILCDDIIAKHSFDPESDNWIVSELKQWLETEGLKLVTN